PRRAGRTAPPAGARDRSHANTAPAAHTIAGSPGQTNALCLNGRVETQVEELPENRVRLRVQVPSADVKHAVEHAASDLAGSVRIPGFRKGKVPLPVLIQRVGKERVYAEAVESHIGGWYRNAVATSR